MGHEFLDDGTVEVASTSRLMLSRLRRLYDQYSFQVIPVMGHLVAGQWKPYEYLVGSIRQFPPQVRKKLFPFRGQVGRPLRRRAAPGSGLGRAFLFTALFAEMWLPLYEK